MSKRRNKAEWQQLIDEQAASGQTQKAFCEQAGILRLAPFGVVVVVRGQWLEGGPIQSLEQVTAAFGAPLEGALVECGQ